MKRELNTEARLVADFVRNEELVKRAARVENQPLATVYVRQDRW